MLFYFFILTGKLFFFSFRKLEEFSIIISTQFHKQCTLMWDYFHPLHWAFKRTFNWKLINSVLVKYYVMICCSLFSLFSFSDFLLNWTLGLINMTPFLSFQFPNLCFLGNCLYFIYILLSFPFLLLYSYFPSILFCCLLLFKKYPGPIYENSILFFWGYLTVFQNVLPKFYFLYLLFLFVYIPIFHNAFILVSGDPLPLVHMYKWTLKRHTGIWKCVGSLSNTVFTIVSG